MAKDPNILAMVTVMKTQRLSIPSLHLTPSISIGPDPGPNVLGGIISARPLVDIIEEKMEGHRVPCYLMLPLETCKTSDWIWIWHPDSDPSIRTRSPPFPIMENLQTTFKVMGASNQSDVSVWVSNALLLASIVCFTVFSWIWWLGFTLLRFRSAFVRLLTPFVR